MNYIRQGFRDYCILSNIKCVHALEKVAAEWAPEWSNALKGGLLGAGVGALGGALYSGGKLKETAIGGLLGGAGGAGIGYTWPGEEPSVVDPGAQMGIGETSGQIGGTIIEPTVASSYTDIEPPVGVESGKGEVGYELPIEKPTSPEELSTEQRIAASLQNANLEEKHKEYVDYMLKKSKTYSEKDREAALNNLLLFIDRQKNEFPTPETTSLQPLIESADPEQPPQATTAALTTAEKIYKNSKYEKELLKELNDIIRTPEESKMIKSMLRDTQYDSLEKRIQMMESLRSLLNRRYPVGK